MCIFRAIFWYDLTMEDDEVLDLVDSKDNVIGNIKRSARYDPGMDGYLRAAELFIQNSQGELWIPRRTMQKTIAPGGLDYSASGHVSSGESYFECLKRETKEELGLNLDTKSVRLVHKFPPTGAEKLFFRAVYLYKTDKVPAYNHEDFSGYEWLSPSGLLSKLKAGEPAKRSLPETIEYLVENQLI